jgi:hypothetical protein
MRAVCGRLKSDYRYSKDIVYNNFPWPDCHKKGSQIGNRERLALQKLAKTILNIRAEYSGSALAELYDPMTMPPELSKAHQALDDEVMKLYGFNLDMTEPEIVAELMERYQKLINIEKK